MKLWEVRTRAHKANLQEPFNVDSSAVLVMSGLEQGRKKGRRKSGPNKDGLYKVQHDETGEKTKSPGKEVVQGR